MSHAAYRGRHRSPARRPLAPTSGSRFSPSGYLLPTAAAATLVLTATGARVDLLAPSPAAATAAAAMTVSSLATEDTITRDLQDRAARSSSRGTAADTSVATDAMPPAADDPARFDAQTAAAVKAENDARAAAAASQAQAQAAAQAQAQADAQAQAQASAARAWAPPLGRGYTLTSGFGMRWGALHPGQDFAVPVGTQVKAMSSGTVVFAGWQGGYGYKVEIRYWDGTVSWYAHNSRVLVSQGDPVSPGEPVALSGNTGNSTGPHVHVEIHPGDGSPVSPIAWLTKLGIMP